ncbi:MAG: site-specific integrase [Micropruina sp.]|nr:site-specific integrase [Micropruina sp.]
MGTRRSFGSTRKLTSGRVQARYVGPDGSRHSAPFTFTAKRDADAWLASESAKITAGRWEPPGRAFEVAVQEAALTFGTYAEEVIERRLATDKIRETTAALYRKLIRLHLAKFSNLPLDQITSRMVANWHASMSRSPSTRKNAYGVLSTVMLQAVRDELIDKTPCRAVAGRQVVKRVDDETDVLEPSDFATYVQAVPETHGYRMAIKVVYWCGLRSGEVRGLRRRDLDLKNAELTVTQQVVKLNGQNVITATTKSNAGLRTVSMPAKLAVELAEWIKTQPVKGRDALLFTSALGRPMSGEALRAAAKKGAEAVGRPELKVHSLRHSNATYYAQAGATTPEMMARFGWSSPAMVTRYSHATRDRARELVNKLDALM